MKVIVKGRGEGKTTELIELCHEQGGYIVVPDHEQARFVYLMAEDLGKSIPLPLTADEFFSPACYGENIPCLYIDNLDTIIQRYAKFAIAAVSLTG